MDMHRKNHLNNIHTLTKILNEVVLHVKMQKKPTKYLVSKC